MKKQLIILSFLTLVSCGSNDECPEPDYSCTNCFRIYDDNGHFVTEGDVGGTGYYGAYWDGTDCKGKKVSCGKYTAVYNLYGSTREQEFLIAGENTVSATGKIACDSLKRNSDGTYYEVYNSGILQCICCQ